MKNKESSRNSSANLDCYFVQFITFIGYLQDSVYEKAKRMNSSLDNVAKNQYAFVELAS